MDGGFATVGAISSALNASIRLWQATYELKTVDQKSRDLLATAAHVETCLNAVKTLRRQKSGLLSRFEKDHIDKIVSNTEKTVQDVAALVEPARVDMDNNCGKVKFKNRVSFALRDSQLVGTNLSRLAINSNSLNTAMGILCNREGNRQIIDMLDTRSGQRGDANNAADPNAHVNSPTDLENRPPPPAYHEIMMRRRAEDERRRSLLSLARGQVAPEDLNGGSGSMEPVNGSMVNDVVEHLATETLPPPIPPRPAMVDKQDVVTTVTQVDETPIFLGIEKPMPAPPEDKISIQVSPNISWEGADGLQVVPPDGLEVCPAEASSNMPPQSRHFSWPSSIPTWQACSPSEPSRLGLGTHRNSSGSMNNRSNSLQPGLCPEVGDGQISSSRTSLISTPPEQRLQHVSSMKLAPSGLGQLHRSHSNASLQTTDSTISGFTGFSDPSNPGLVSRPSMIDLRDDAAVPLRSMSGRERSRALLQHLANR